jgi:hypothetical protein
MTPGQMDLPTLARMIQQGTPGIKPEVFAKALQKGAALLHPFAQDQLRQMMIQVQQGRLQQGEERVQQGAERLDLERQKLGERQKVFGIKEARYNAQNQVKNNVQFQKLEMERQRLEATLNKNTLEKYKAILKTQHDIMSHQIQAAAAGLDEDARKELKAEEEERYRDQLKAIKGMLPSSGKESATTSSEGYPVPQEFADKPEGFQLQDDGA